MTWTEPKEDWKMGDAPSNGDFNRIEKNTKHIFDMIGAVGGIATLDQDGKSATGTVACSGGNRSKLGRHFIWGR
jgi:hypothetical protein